ncbi:MAG: transcriptional regulator [Catenulispora sp.]
MNLTAAAVLAVSYVALITAHEVADHWLQTPCQAMTKGGSGWAARAACARHVATLTVSKVAALLVPFLMFHLPIRPLWWAVGLGIDAVSHYWADRRTTLRRLAELCGPGKLAFYNVGSPRQGKDDNPSTGTGAYLLDQSWHKFFLYLTVLILAGGAR